MRKTASFARTAPRPTAVVNGLLIFPEARDFHACGDVVMHRRLNGFFAISVNSPSMSMVNFSCCVGAAPFSARGVTRRVTPQPMRAAVRMEAGAHACL